MKSTDSNQTVIFHPFFFCHGNFLAIKMENLFDLFRVNFQTSLQLHLK